MFQSKNAATGAGKTRPVKALLKQLNSRLAADIGSVKAGVIMTGLHESARNLIGQKPADGGK